MLFDEYQNEARRTASNQGDKVSIFALGLCGEAGEVADLIKKWKGHGHDLDKTKITKELGDVLWYVSNLADQLGINLDVIAQTNVAKLRARYPDGFSVEASKTKADEGPVFRTMALCAVCGLDGGHYGEPCPQRSNLAGLAQREAQAWPVPHSGSPEVVGTLTNGAPVNQCDGCCSGDHGSGWNQMICQKDRYGR